MILCDTGVFIQLVRGNSTFEREILRIGSGNLGISDISVGDIYFGIRRGESRRTKELIRYFQRFTLSKDVSKLFVEIMSDRSLPRMTIPDALIAATAITNQIQLFTLNVNDFKFFCSVIFCRFTDWLINNNCSGIMADNFIIY